MMTIKIIRGTVVNKCAVDAGRVLDVPEAEGRELIRMGKAIEYHETVIETATEKRATEKATLRRK